VESGKCYIILQEKGVSCKILRGGYAMNRPIREIVGERVLLLRRRARLSQPELAQQADMSVTTLNRVENAHQSLYGEDENVQLISAREASCVERRHYAEEPR
jgi:DNA-binding XRE family transcriptional regulator